MSDELDLSSSFVVDITTDLLSLVSNIVVKREDLANTYETVDSAVGWDLYLTALRKHDTFETYDEYTLEILLAAGVPLNIAVEGVVDKDTIPSNYHDSILEVQRAYIIANFVEKNNYYRMLNGLPDYAETIFIYINEEVSGVDTTKPVHEMTNDEITILTALGYIDNVIAMNPKYKYLQYLGSKKISIISARNAKKFDILRIGYINNVLLKRRFNANYELSKTYILNNYYNRRYSIDNTYFDAYIGYIILTNAMIMTVNSSVDIFNSKEVTNDQTMKGILASYGLDLFDDIPASYRKKIADNINSLVVSKGSDEVIMKIFKICGFGNVEVRKFVLVKEHLKDINDKYIFSYELDGVTPKYSEMYDVYFSQVDISAQNIYNEIQKPANKLAYFDVVNSDIYWGAYETNEDIRQRLLREEFNYIDTDYININTAYSISTLTNELSYFFSMIFDLKDYINNMVFMEPFFNSTIDLFYAIVMLAALISKKIGWNGEIITDPELVAALYRFNFSATETKINSILTKYNVSNITAAQLKTILPPNIVTSTTDLTNLYFNNAAVLAKFRTLMLQVKELHEYLALKEIYEYVMIGKTTAAIFKMPNGNIATTYFEYLTNINPVIGAYVNDLSTVNAIDTVISQLLMTLEDYIDTTNFEYLFLKIPSFSNENVFKSYLMKIINVFKAFNINIFSMSITYNIDSTAENVKIIDSYGYSGDPFIHNNVSIHDTFGYRLSNNANSNLHIRDSLEYTDKDGNFHIL